MTERELEKKAMEFFPQWGWVLWFPKKQQFLRFDIFGVFDFMALDKTSGQVYFYQLTTAPNRAARRKKIQAFIDENKILRGHYWLWSWDHKEQRFKTESF